MLSKPNKTGYDPVPESVTGGSIRSTLFSFGTAALFGVAGAFAFAAGRPVLEAILIRLTADWIVNANNAAGYANLSAIISSVSLAALWLIGFMCVWHRAEKAKDMPARLRIGLISAGGAAIFALLMHLTGLIFL